jgi:hypothetical protein
MSFFVHSPLAITVTRTAAIMSSASIVGLASHVPNLAAGFYVQGGASGRLSHVKIKRPDGTWATVYVVAGVHIRRPDGTWEILV